MSLRGTTLVHSDIDALLDEYVFILVDIESGAPLKCPDCGRIGYSDNFAEMRKIRRVLEKHHHRSLDIRAFKLPIGQGHYLATS